MTKRTDTTELDQAKNIIHRTGQNRTEHDITEQRHDSYEYNMGKKAASQIHAAYLTSQERGVSSTGAQRQDSTKYTCRNPHKASAK